MLQLHTPQQATQWLREHVRGTLRADSRQLAAGDGWLAWPGSGVDARHYVQAALQAGAAACLLEQEDAVALDDARVAYYAGLKPAAGPIAAGFFQHPSQALAVVAVTGTNGKTSSTWWLAQALGLVGQRCGLVGTLGVGEPGDLVPSGLTTPDPVHFQQQLRRFADQGFAACAVEASSIGLAEHRLDGTLVHTAVFTNFTQDHLDYHGSMEAYWAAKRALFAWPGLQVVVVNLDDAKGPELAAQLRSPSLDVWTFSCLHPARLRAQAVVCSANALTFRVIEGEQSCAVSAPFVGNYNVANLLGVIAVLRSRGVPLEAAAQLCSLLSNVPGRMEIFSVPGQPLAVVDYAHTPDALEKALQALRPNAQQRGGKLWCVFGCGGERDTLKRPRMAAVAQSHADHVVLTSDNPRYEKPQSIVDHILAGLQARSNVHVDLDRAQAIAHALGCAQPQDVVLIAGKGHEAYQDIDGVKHPFSDRAQVQSFQQSVSNTLQHQGAWA